MNRIQHRRVTCVVSSVAVAFVLAVGTLPATAQQDPGAATHEPASTTFCALERVSSQFVACDNLTGNGVPAPAWVDER